jgi:cold shock CspA family protein
MNATTMHQGEEDAVVNDVVGEERATGQVKWFNDIEKYGFIFPADGSEDIFVHLTDLSPMHNTEKPTLYTGEYVSFKLSTNGENQDGSVRIKAVDVKGVFGGTLMCDHGEISFRQYSRVGFGEESGAEPEDDDVVAAAE